MNRRRSSGAVLFLIVLGAFAAQAAEGPDVRRSGKDPEKIAEALAALKKNPRDPEAHLLLGKHYARTAECEKAVEHLEQANALRPDHEESLRELGDALLEMEGRAKEKADEANDYIEKAEAAAKALLALKPKQKESYEFLVRLARRKAAICHDQKQYEKEQDRLDEALGYCDKVLAIDSNDISTHLDRIRILFEQKKYKDAELRCNEVLKINPKLHQPRLTLAQIKKANGDKEGAVKILTGILAERPTQIEALLRRGEIYLDMGKYEEALADANEAIRLTNRNPYANFIRGCVYMQLKKMDKSVEELRAAADGMPDHVPSHFWLARCLLLKDRRHDGIEELKIVIKLDPSFAQSYLILGNAYLDQGDPEAAIKVLEKAVALDPKNADIYRLLGMAYLHNGDDAQAERCFNKIMEIDP